MNRRTILGVCGSALTAGCVDSATEALQGTTDPMNQSLGGDFDRIEFSSDGTASLYFENDHECSGFAIAHVADENLEDHSLMMCEAPRFEGPVEANLMQRVRRAGVDFPSNEFHAIGLEGQFDECGEKYTFQVFGDETSRATFFVPEDIWTEEPKTGVVE